MLKFLLSKQVVLFLKRNSSSLEVALFEIQVMVPLISAPRQCDQWCAVLFLCLPAGRAHVPAGFLPMVIISENLLSVPHVLCVKMQTKHASPDELMEKNPRKN